MRYNNRMASQIMQKIVKKSSNLGSSLISWEKSAVIGLLISHGSGVAFSQTVQYLHDSRQTRPHGGRTHASRPTSAILSHPRLARRGGRYLPRGAAAWTVSIPSSRCRPRPERTGCLQLGKLRFD